MKCKDGEITNVGQTVYAPANLNGGYDPDPEFSGRVITGTAAYVEWIGGPPVNSVDWGWGPGRADIAYISKENALAASVNLNKPRRDAWIRQADNWLFDRAWRAASAKRNSDYFCGLIRDYWCGVDGVPRVVAMLKAAARTKMNAARISANGRDGSFNDDGGWDTIYDLQSDSELRLAAAKALENAVSVLTA